MSHCKAGCGSEWAAWNSGKRAAWNSGEKVEWNSSEWAALNSGERVAWDSGERVVRNSGQRPYIYIIILYSPRERVEGSCNSSPLSILEGASYIVNR